jgi:cytochrome c biogenesis protein CcmG/thiol:disulfide interchange protein DsbE
MKALKFGIPLALFIGLAAFLLRGLWLNPREVPSPLIGKPAPAFSAPMLTGSAVSAQFSSEGQKGKVWVMNVWASWCPTCPAEKPQLKALVRASGVPLVGLNYKDTPTPAARALERFGNPYGVIAEDPQGRVGLDYGVYGTPETFVIDKQGIIRYKHIGPISPEALATKVLPLVAELQKS